jgi:hypothetical protein
MMTMRWLLVAVLASVLFAGCASEDEKVPEPMPADSMNPAVGAPVESGGTPGSAPVPTTTAAPGDGQSSEASAGKGANPGGRGSK